MFVCECIATTKTEKDYPEEKNWVDEGAVTPPKNQGDTCGSCWAFAATGNMESIYKIAHGELLSFSEQQLVDCDHECWTPDDCDEGCDGGYAPTAMNYVLRNGITTEEAYPYIGRTKKCKYNTTSMPYYNFSKRVRILGNVSEDNMVAALNEIGPLAIGVDANWWQWYMGGVFNLPCGKEINHGVLLVGYGIHKDKKYWLIKNSWGEWGMDGYMRLIRGKDKCRVNDFIFSVLP